MTSTEHPRPILFGTSEVKVGRVRRRYTATTVATRRVSMPIPPSRATNPTDDTLGDDDARTSGICTQRFSRALVASSSSSAVTQSSSSSRGYAVGAYTSMPRSASTRRPASASSTSPSSIPSSLSQTHPCAVFLGGPVLVTAPHAKEVWRDGEHSAVKGICGRRLHKRELFTSEVVLHLAQSFFRCPPRIGASYIVWNVRAMASNGDAVAAELDPNYLFQKDHAGSAWHAALKAFRMRWGGLPLLHIDIHGKKDRKDNLHVDVGLSALKSYNADCWSRVKEFMSVHLTALMAAMPPHRSGKPYGVTFPEAGERGCGFWGHSESECDVPWTMSHQSCSLGIIGIQLEVPRTLRIILAHNPILLDQWCNIFQELYLLLPNACRTSRDMSLEAHRRSAVPCIATSEFAPATSQLLSDVCTIGAHDTAKPI